MTLAFLAGLLFKRHNDDEGMPPESDRTVAFEDAALITVIICGQKPHVQSPSDYFRRDD